MRLALLAALAVLALTGCADDAPEDVQAGDCLTISGVGDTAGGVPVVPCDGIHEAEVYALFEVADDAAYDEAAIVAEVEERCVDDFASYVGEDYRTSSLDIFYTYPLADGWAEGDREAMCAVFAPDPDSGAPVRFEGTLAG